MNKEALRDDYIAKGWEVQPVDSWIKVSSIEGKDKYDANVVSPDNKFSTAQVIVTDDGGAGETAVPDGVLKAVESSFTTELKAFMLTKETGKVFAVALKSARQDDEVAEVDVYTDVTGGVSSETYVIKRREGVFDFKKLI